MQPAVLGFNPINFLIFPQRLQQNLCIICTEKSINLMRCKTCKKCLCYQCAADQKQKNNKCPLRCTPNQLQLEPLTDLKLYFRCPFSQQCKKFIKTVKQFYEHDRTCQFIEWEQIRQQNKKWEFLCTNYHPLEIYLDQCDKLQTRRKCSLCSQISLTRVMCRKCDQYFCRYCRPFPIYNQKCPLGHQFVKNNIKSLLHKCAQCEMISSMIGPDFYDDNCCNLGLCSNCYKNRPKFQKPVKYIQNLNKYCEEIGCTDKKQTMSIGEYYEFRQMHKLTILPSLSEQRCSWCQKRKLCYKKCLKCYRHYCFKCKRLDILQDDECEFGHEFSAIFSEKEQQIVCYSCYKKNGSKQNSSAFYTDKSCKVTLCLDCIQECKVYNFSVVNRAIQSFNRKCAFGNHLCRFLPANKDYNDRCSICQKEKKIKFVCNGCSEIRRYCCSCLRPKNKTQCYCNKKLKLQPNLNKNFCLLCNKLGQNEIYGCKPCGYSICLSCLSEKEH